MIIRPINHKRSSPATIDHHQHNHSHLVDPGPFVSQSTITYKSNHPFWSSTIATRRIMAEIRANCYNRTNQKNCHVISRHNHRRPGRSMFNQSIMSFLLSLIFIIIIVPNGHSTSSGLNSHPQHELWSRRSTSLTSSPTLNRRNVHQHHSSNMLKKSRTASQHQQQQSNYAYHSESGAIRRHSSQSPQSVSSSSSHMANYNQYLNSQLLSIPFAPNPLYQHQMLPHHSTFSGLSSSRVTSHMANDHHHDHMTHHDHHGLESNSLTALSSNSIRPKGSKWWDIARNPSSGHQTISLDHLNHVNAIRSSSSSRTSNNLNLPLRKKQRRLVKENPGLLNAISNAMRMAINECQNQLKDHRWNCPVTDWKKGKNVFGKIIQTGCRETAFVYALTSAAVAHSIARACSEGLISTCTCDYSPNKQPKDGNDWQWGGCSDNIKFGYKYARSFVDAAERGRDQRFVMNLHNNEAGRRLVSEEKRQECKCHGMSGSCTVKTCWIRLASFHEIGNNLKERFDKALRVKVGNDFRGLARNRYKYKNVQLETYEKGYPKPTETDLIYFEESPDFCIANPKYGLSGTKGRECNASSISVDSCNLVCCDRGYTTEEIEVTERCNCTFRWCCEVNCNICKVKKQIHRCK